MSPKWLSRLYVMTLRVMVNICKYYITHEPQRHSSTESECFWWTRLLWDANLLPKCKSSAARKPDFPLVKRTYSTVDDLFLLQWFCEEFISFISNGVSLKFLSVNAAVFGLCFCDSFSLNLKPSGSKSSDVAPLRCSVLHSGRILLQLRTSLMYKNTKYKFYWLSRKKILSNFIDKAGFTQRRHSVCLI